MIESSPIQRNYYGIILYETNVDFFEMSHTSLAKRQATWINKRMYTGNNRNNGIPCWMFYCCYVGKLKCPKHYQLFSIFSLFLSYKIWTFLVFFCCPKNASNNLSNLVTIKIKWCNGQFNWLLSHLAIIFCAKKMFIYGRSSRRRW